MRIDGIVPIYIMTDEEKIETIPEQMAYIVGKNGCFLKKNNKLYSSVTEIKEIPMLQEIETTAEIEFEKLKFEMFQSIEKFFTDVYKKHSSEVAILLYYNFEEKRWGWLVPKQTVSGASVDYKLEESKFIYDDGTLADAVPDKYTQMGSIHSHASMSAFHSGTDDKDEYNFDGLHITIGSFNSTMCTYSTRWIISGEEIKSDIKEVVEEYEMQGGYPSEVMDLVSKPVVKTSTTVYTKGGKKTFYPQEGRTKSKSKIGFTQYGYGNYWEQ